MFHALIFTCLIAWYKLSLYFPPFFGLYYTIYTTTCVYLISANLRHASSLLFQKFGLVMATHNFSCICCQGAWKNIFRAGLRRQNFFGIMLNKPELFGTILCYLLLAY